ncbi:MAG TPA: AmmeMemoRadiSam system radical SAM enzyme [Thermodesulfobacteriota bacterium]|nr:AmmeMemoRadiSam system radical SAM enzyme [Thermodesulfobacteriota bacterium]
MKEALLYDRLPGDRVQCRLCNHGCVIGEAKRGICGVRENRGGTLYTLVYERLIARNADPIEKKPMFHFAPGSKSFSIATPGCNFRCDFCQNYEISQMPRDRDLIAGEEVSPQEAVDEAVRRKCKTISYTYTEPTIYFEYALDIARLATAAGLKNIFVTNGYMTEDALKAIHPDLHGANVDLKAFREDFYQKRCGGKLDGVLRSLRVMKDLGVWVEITTLIIPGLNDSEEELEELARFIVSLGPEVPWHISRFHPMYKMLDRSPTSVGMLERARQIGIDAGLRYVYTGNVPGDTGEDTFCFQCGQLLVDRFGFQIGRYEIKNSKCPQCGAAINGVDL